MYWKRKGESVERLEGREGPIREIESDVLRGIVKVKVHPALPMSRARLPAPTGYLLLDTY
ncbi:hypothetical protein WN55_06928 [Dufourea novaeangliae]|uniref:Uncharacterized protein n=1 Tax=Dufourea novaeangliae TaxID=178035 RepID=A0A154PT74_DUFNO|nr:hypothetical protein WN55_06928 [Dufourea novaeangliae]